MPPKSDQHEASTSKRFLPAVEEGAESRFD